MFKNILNSKILIQCRHYAARKGTREKARKKKVHIEVKKTVYVPKNLRDSHLKITRAPILFLNEENKIDPIDDVYFMNNFKTQLLSLKEAIQINREILHPTMLNAPNELINVQILCNMNLTKKNKFLDAGTHYIPVPHKFYDNQDNKVLYFSKSQDDISLALENGVQLAGGIELIKEIQHGQHLIQDYKFILANPNILTELLTIKGLMKKKFPNIRNQNIGEDVMSMVNKYINGLELQLKRDEIEKSNGWIDTSFGTLNMDDDKLEENFTFILEYVNNIKSDIIKACALFTNKSTNKIPIHYTSYILKKDDQEKSKEELQ